jgi:hypothetical protein
LSFDYSERQKRIGTIINNLGLVFWEESDKFKTEKVIKKFIGDKIYYLNLCDEWISTDHNTIYFWDIKE